MKYKPLIESATDLLGIGEENFHGLLTLLDKALVDNIPGAVVELGCAQGVTTTYLRRVMDELHRYDLHVFDSFEGLPAKRDEDGGDGRFAQHSFAMGPEILLANFAKRGLTPPVIHKGWFGEITDYPGTIAFAFLDGDFYDSITDGLRMVWPRLASGAVVAVHDYGYDPLPGVERACNDFFGPLGITVQDDVGIHYFTKP